MPLFRLRALALCIVVEHHYITAAAAQAFDERLVRGMHFVALERFFGIKTTDQRDVEPLVAALAMIPNLVRTNRISLI